MSDDDIDLPSGLYYCQMTAQNDGEMFYKENHPMYLQSYHNKYGNTDATGTFKIDDKKPFINLFKTDSLQIIDEYGVCIGTEAFSETTVICLYQENSPQFVQMEYVKVKNKKNEFEIIWDPEMKVTELSIIESNKLQNSPFLQLRGSDDDIVPSDDAQLLGNYPNPFN